MKGTATEQQLANSLRALRVRAIHFCDEALLDGEPNGYAAAMLLAAIKHAEEALLDAAGPDARAADVLMIPGL